MIFNILNFLPLCDVFVYIFFSTIPQLRFSNENVCMSQDIYSLLYVQNSNEKNANKLCQKEYCVCIFIISLSSGKLYMEKWI